jgi:hypothetical protein
MTNVRVSARRDLDVGEGGDTRRDTSVDVVMEILMTATPVTTETVAAKIFELIEKYENRKRRRRCEAPTTALAPSRSRSRM